MPKSAYYGGHGDEVARKMRRRYGKKRGDRIFYATAKKRGQEPESNKDKLARKLGKRRRASRT